MPDERQQIMSEQVRGWMCWSAHRLSDFWNFVEKRMLILHTIFAGVAWGTYRITVWAMGFADAHPQMSGAEMAMVLAAVCVPFTALQMWALKLEGEVILQARPEEGKFKNSFAPPEPPTKIVETQTREQTTEIK